MFRKRIEPCSTVVDEPRAVDELAACRRRARGRTSAGPRARRSGRRRGSSARRSAPRRSPARTASPLPSPGLGDERRRSAPGARRSAARSRRACRPLEPPSTKIELRARAPSRAARSTSGGRFPPRSGTGRRRRRSAPRAGSASGRATIQYVRQRWLNGQMFATKPLRRGREQRDVLGKEDPPRPRHGSNPASSRRLRMSSALTQLRIGLRGFRWRRSARRDHRPPEPAVGVDDHPRVARGVPPQRARGGRSGRAR